MNCSSCGEHPAAERLGLSVCVVCAGLVPPPRVLDREALQRIGHVVLELRTRGWSLELREYGEDHETPGLLGQIRGVTVWGRRAVKIALRPHDSLADLADTFEHELRHVREPEWDCGHRDVLGRGGPRGVTPSSD